MSHKNNRKKGYRNINFAAAVTCFVVIIVIVMVLAIGSGNRGEDTSSAMSDYSAESISAVSDILSEPELSVPEEPSIPEMKFTTVTVETSSVHSGDLIVVNPQHPIVGEPADTIVSVWEKKTSHYKLADLSVRYAERLIPNLNDMLDDLYDNASSGALTLSSGYRTIQEQQTIHDSNRNTNGREPEGGCSDLNTGLSFTAWVYPSTEGNIRQGKFAWLSENCYDYGFILRYPDGKSNLTGIDASSDYYITYRYVGLPHSYLIYINDYCLEEYIEFVMRFSADNRYSFSKDLNEYEIYYVPASEGETTDIAVPSDYSYTISGDNIGGFIVTVMK